MRDVNKFGDLSSAFSWAGWLVELFISSSDALLR
jgi:hypothetical protein